MVWVLVSNRKVPKRNYVRGGGMLVMIVGKNAWSKSEMKKSVEFMRLAADMSNGIKKKLKIGKAMQ